MFSLIFRAKGREGERNTSCLLQAPWGSSPQPTRNEQGTSWCWGDGVMLHHLRHTRQGRGSHSPFSCLPAQHICLPKVLQRRTQVETGAFTQTRGYAERTTNSTRRVTTLLCAPEASFCLGGGAHTLCQHEVQGNISQGPKAERYHTPKVTELPARTHVPAGQQDMECGGRPGSRALQ